MIDASLIKSISDLATEAKTPVVLPLPAEPAGTYGLYVDGKLDVRRAWPADRSYGLARLNEVSTALRRWGEKDASVVFVSEHGVCLVFNEKGDRRERAFLPLAFSEQYKTLRVLAEKQHEPAAWLEQRELLSLLRNQLGMAKTTFAAQVKKLKVVGSEVKSAVVDRGRESLGVEAEAEVFMDDGANLPEEIAVKMPVFEHLVYDGVEEFTFTPTVNVDFLAAGPKFKLTPGPGEIRRGLDEALDWIVERLVDDGVDCTIVVGSIPKV